MEIPPLFKQGASARVRVTVFALLSIVMLVVDARMHVLGTIRQALATALYPFQTVAMMPRDAATSITDSLVALNTLQKENRELRQQQIVNAQLLQQERLLAAENAQLRKLLEMQQKVPVKSIVGEILYDARDPFTRKIILNRGSQQGVEAGQPVIDEVGIVGQVTRVFPFTSEVTLLTDKDQAIPVQVLRNGLRSVAYGRGQTGALDLRFMPANADIQKGDMLVTSGIDGIYPPGLAVASVALVETRSADSFARIVCRPLAGIDRHRQLLILLVEQNLPPRPQPDVVDEKSAKLFKRRLRDSTRDTSADDANATPKDKPAEERKGAAGAAAAAAPGAAAAAATTAPAPAKPAAKETTR
ncbi:rod shape-determining protein MreC [Herbaspirillum seropedicae]|uniref:rod shape-determining protein MreC n=1 Tax=Herbaspirillum seropedicae TaxID=964 RepID=UPI000863AD22|nr:rod shape-determining protein MreC [Herbaspirillum seropedicae]AON57063.1 rod shape-determining MreC transmembrane protein [Herbaspirillum seropedicae]